jgi:hypothetical protein
MSPKRGLDTKKNWPTVGRKINFEKTPMPLAQG